MVDTPQRSGSTPSSPDPEVILYTRPGCHLCDEAKSQIRELQKRVRFEVREVNVNDDPELECRYGQEVPVVSIYGKKAFKYRIDARQFLKRLEAGPGSAAS